ncbi:Yil091c protein [Candida orthopsilosis Co 90-125]|uniref:U3 small nucleolar RNA-associated protein 25 n=1 Tax=Candida orthopsilosis (strain 90-125) TaxID=1136231 RepID=H8X584_CANO9|nr:Yil091c protein [Candida orthopsilosis Co 90-125]CCG23177.1 Yil091c protein [Candida orthopsilosis Co 90-125]
MTGRSKRGHNNDNSGHHRDRNVKRGRTELRTVTRTSQRPKRDDKEKNHSIQTIDNGDTLKDQSDSKMEDVSEEEDLSGKAYSALLTLLKSKNKEKSNLEQNETKIAQEEQNQDANAEDDEELAGENFAEDNEESESESENEEEDSPAELAIDPFEVHFNQPSDEYLEKEEKLVIKEHNKWTTSSKVTYEDLSLSSTTLSPPGETITHVNNKKDTSTIKDFKSLKMRVLDAYENEFGEDVTKLDSILLQPILNYQDVNYQYKTYANKTYKKLYAMHALNHIYKTRDRIIKNTAKLHQAAENNQDLELRDQGFTRPKVLILLPSREACHTLVELLIKLSGTTQQENKKRFTTQFHAKDVPRSNKPQDFQDAFKGNNNDYFCIGLKLTRKSLKLYSSFYTSDIIIASPLGLSMILENPDKKKRQYDFISSIEVLIVDRANQIEMQNWDHVNTIMKYINKVPKDFHDADFSRIRMWSINDQAKLLRQTLVFCEYLTPSINNLVSSKSFNLSGKTKFKPIIISETSIMNSIGIKIKQIFQRFPSESPATDPDSRFKFFINSVLPNLLKTTSYEDGIMIYIPSYFDYLRIKDYFKTSTKFNFGAIDEYSSQSKLTRTRHEFANGKIKIMLYTERLHYFRRYEVGGVKNIIMYAPPTNPIFYKELIRFIAKSVFKDECDLNLVTVKILYSKWDATALDRIVGNERAPILCHSRNEMYEFR